MCVHYLTLFNSVPPNAGTVQWGATALHCTKLYCAVLYCNVPNSTVLYCTVLYYSVPYHTALYCIGAAPLTRYAKQAEN